MKAHEIMDSVLRLHNKKKTEKMLYKIIRMLMRTDGREVIFNSREDLILGRKIICTVIEKCDLTFHAGRNVK